MLSATASSLASSLASSRAVPTRETYSELQQAYEHFNQRLFDDALPHCLITLQREKRTCGYFSAARFASLPDADKYVLMASFFARNQPPTNDTYRVLVYTELSPVADVRVTVHSPERVRISYQAKYVGLPNDLNG